VTTAKTRSYAAEGRLSLAPVSEWLRSDALAPHLERLEDVWRVEAARILPELLAGRPELPRPLPMTEYGDRLRFFEGLARAVLAAPQPLLLLIDDLQWCDRETIEWLHVLARFDPQARLLVLGTARSEEWGAAHPLAALLRDLRGDGQLVEVALEPLDAAENGGARGSHRRPGSRRRRPPRASIARPRATRSSSSRPCARTAARARPTCPSRRSRGCRRGRTP
jgi:hypothetical protein